MNMVGKTTEGTAEFVTSGLEKLEKFNFETHANSPFLRERISINAILRTAKAELDLQRKLDNDAGYREAWEKISDGWDDCDETAVDLSGKKPSVKKMAKMEISDGISEEDIKEISEKIEKKHQEFLQQIKNKLDRDPALMSVFERLMEEDGFKEVLDYIKTI